MMMIDSGRAPLKAVSQVSIPNADAALTAAIERQREIRRLLPALTAELKRLDGFIDTWCDMVGAPRPKRSGQRRTYKSRNIPKEEVARECVAILTEIGRPLSRQELLDALNERGIELYGKDPAMVLSTMLWRSRDAITRTPVGYVPAAPHPTTQKGSDNA